MKKHYITPAIKTVTFAFNQSLLADSIQGGLDENPTGTQYAGGHRNSRGSWGNLWDGGDE